jgi:predicted dehydrogenase
VKLRTAVVGGGTVSGVHLEGLRRNPRTELVAICDVDQARAREVAREYEIRPYTDVEQMLADVDLDWIHVCTPVQTHVDVALPAIEAGIPVMIEKPVTETVEEYERLEAAARRYDVPVTVKHNHVFDPVMRRARAKLAAGDLGTVKGVDVIYTGSSRPDTPNRGTWSFDLVGGEFEEGLAHPLYLTLRAGGYPRDEAEIKATTTRFGTYDRAFAYDAAQVQYVSESGVLCSTKMLSETVPVRLMHVHGDEASMTADFVSQTLLVHDRDYKASAAAKALNNVDRVVDSTLGTLENARAVAERALADDWERAKELNAHFYQDDLESKALITGDELPVPLEEGGWTVRLMAAIREAAASTPDERPVERPVGQSDE